MTDQITVVEGEYGRRGVIKGVPSGELTKSLVESRFPELELNQGKGWQGNDLSFLAELPWTRSLILIDFRMPAVEPIHSLHELRALKVFTYCKTEIKFAAFPHLEHCALEWRPKATSLFDCAGLTTLFVNRYKGKNTDPFGRLVNLESLAVLNAPIEDLSGLSTLRKLRSLRLANLRRLGSLAGAERLATLEELKIDTCKTISSIEELSGLHNLRRLLLDNLGDIESLRPLAGLTGLEWVLFCESTNVLDGDLSPIRNLPNLRRIAFMNRRHYSHRREDFGAAYTG